MVVANALRKEDAFENQESPTTRGEVLARYRQLREISKLHHSNAMDFLSMDAIMHHARRLGLASGKTLILDSMDELTLAVDLAIHTAPVGRSRAIDRYARSARFASGSDEALVLEAMCSARFAVVLVQRRHRAAGLTVTDLFRKTELWLVDEGLEISLPEGTAFATRYFTPDRFSMTAGVGMPVDFAVLTNAIRSAPQLLRKLRAEAPEDRRFAEAIYRAAIADGTMERIAYQTRPGPAMQFDRYYAFCAWGVPNIPHRWNCSLASYKAVSYMCAMKVVATLGYDRRARKLLTPTERAAAELEIALAPTAWPVIRGTGGARAARGDEARAAECGSSTLS